jgi:hypothetical protein
MSTTGWRPLESRSRFWNSGNSHEFEGTVDSPFHLELLGSAAQQDPDR